MSSSQRSKITEATPGVKLFYLDEGAGDPVVLVHGLIEDYRAWSNQITPLSKRYWVISYSRRFSAPNENLGDIHEDTVENNTEDLFKIINNLGISPAHLIGHSYGGLITTYFAYGHPELVRSLVLVEPAVGSVLIENPRSALQRLRLFLTHPSAALAASEFINSTQKPALSAMRRGEPKMAVKLLIDGIQGKRGAFEEQFSEEFRNMAIENAKSIYVYENSWSVFKRGQMKQIKVPTLIIKGENTNKVQSNIADLLHNLLHGSEEDTIPKSAHFPQLENSEDLNAKLMEFLERQKSAKMR